MGESLIQRYCVSDEAYFGCKALSPGKIMTVPGKEVPANSVPAAAVIQGGLVLFGITGRKGHVGG
jgi:CHASE2 domain-containing sensor protein